MATYVKTDYVPNDCDYLTVGKEYLVDTDSPSGGRIVCDDGIETTVYFSCSSHLDNRSWIVINR